MNTYAEIARDLNDREIAARQKVWKAFIAGEAVELDAAECGALWTSILQTGKELSWYREQLPIATARIEPFFCDHEGPGPHDCRGTAWEHES
jgi:hypothetical protein